jgi:hypothetical protein
MSKFDSFSVAQLFGIAENLYGKSFKNIPPILSRADLVEIMLEWEEEFIHNLSANSKTVIEARF